MDFLGKTGRLARHLRTAARRGRLEDELAEEIAGHIALRTRALIDAGLDPREAAWYWQQYAATDADRTDPDLAPLLSDRLGTLPPTLVVTAEHDPLRDEGEELVVRLADAGVSVVGTRYQGQVHGFWRHPSVFTAAEPLTRQVAGFLRMHP